MFDTEFTTPERPESDGLSKHDLIGSVLVVLTASFDPKFPGRYGETPAWRGDILVASGAHTGTFIEGRTEMGLLGGQLGALPVGKTGVCRVLTGQGQMGKPWIGADFDVTVDEMNAARRVISVYQSKLAAREEVPAF